VSRRNVLKKNISYVSRRNVLKKNISYVFKEGRGTLQQSKGWFTSNISYKQQSFSGSRLYMNWEKTTCNKLWVQSGWLVQTGNEADGFTWSHRLLANTPNRRQKKVQTMVGNGLGVDIWGFHSSEKLNFGLLGYNSI